jgi:hypothetical protein
MTTLATQIAANWTDASYLDGPNKDWSTLRRQLEQGSAQERRDALKRVLALMVQGQPMGKLFPAVVSNLLQPDYELKRFVYIYLQQYADSEPQLVLLAVNALYKDLQHPEPWVRSQALRHLTLLRISALRQIMWLAIHRGVRDRHPAVRQSAALSIPAVLVWGELDEQQAASAVTMSAERIASAMTAPLWQLLLNDDDASVLAATVAALSMLDRGATLKIPPVVAERLAKKALMIQPILTPGILHHFLRHVVLHLMATQTGGNGLYDEAELKRFQQAVLELAEACLRSLSGAVAMAGAATLYQLQRASNGPLVDDAVRTFLRYIDHRESGLRLIALRVLHIIALREPTRLARYARYFMPLFAGDEPTASFHQIGILLVLAKRELELASLIIQCFDIYLKMAEEPLAIQAVQAMGVIITFHQELEEVVVERLSGFWFKERTLSGRMHAAVGRLLLLVASDALHAGRQWRAYDPCDLLKAIVLDERWYHADPSAQAYMLWVLGLVVDAVGSVADEVLRRWIENQRGRAANLVRLELLRLAWRISQKRPPHHRIQRALYSLLLAGLKDTDVDVFDYATELVQRLSGASNGAEDATVTTSERTAFAEPNRACSFTSLSSAVADMQAAAEQVAWAPPPALVRGCLLCAMSSVEDSSAADASCLPDFDEWSGAIMTAVAAETPTAGTASTSKGVTAVPLEEPTIGTGSNRNSSAIASLDAFFGEALASPELRQDQRTGSIESLIPTSSLEETLMTGENSISMTADASLFDSLLDAGLVPRERVEYLRPRILAESNLDALFDELIAVASAEMQLATSVPDPDLQIEESLDLLPAGMANRHYESSEPTGSGEIPEGLGPEAHAPSAS